MTMPFLRTSTPALFTLLLTLTLGLPAWACLNQYGKMNVHGETIPPGERRENFSYHISRLRNHGDHDAIVAAPAPTEPAAGADFKTRSDFAVALVHRGDSKKAVGILESVEKEHPGEYIVAANLGTAYELSGDLEKAFQWIQEGIRRNPKSHEGSEWLHLRILWARQALAKDPDWVKSHGVLDLDFGGEAIPRKPTVWPEGVADAESLIQALTYQLSERLAFVPPPDPLVGGLIADLADLLALFRSVDHAIPVYELALQYQPVRAELISRRLASSMEVRQEENRRAHPSEKGRVMLVLTVAVVVAGIAVLLWIRKGAVV
jgi:tetratricopeptide (TPR) repeat protein